MKTSKMVAVLASAVLAAWVFGASASAADAKAGLKAGTPELKSAGALAFAPDGVLLVGDAPQAAVFAIDTGDASGSPPASLEVEKLGEKIADMLGVAAADILVNDLAVNPTSGATYVSVSRGRGPDASPIILRVSGDGEISELSLKNVPFAKATLPNAPEAGKTDRRGEPLRNQAITDLEYVEGRVYIAGLSNEEFASNLRSIAYPFKEADEGTSVEIYHGAHGQFETASPVRTFTHYAFGGKEHLLAAYTCTPLVKIPVSQLKPGEKIRGTTIAELGNRNRPLDMIVYEKDGADYILIANSNRGVMKVTTENIANIEGITEPVEGTAGLTYETVESLKGVAQMDRLNETSALLLVQNEGEGLALKTVELP